MKYLLATLAIISLGFHSSKRHIYIRGTVSSDDPQHTPVEQGWVYIQYTKVYSPTSSWGTYVLDVTQIADTTKEYKLVATSINHLTKDVYIKRKIRKSQQVDIQLSYRVIECFPQPLKAKQK